MMKLSLTVVVATALLSGCSLSANDYVRGVPPAQTESAALGTLTFQETTLVGPDANDNGARDELDLFIRTLYATEAERIAATKYVQEVTKALIAGSRGQGASSEQKMAYVDAAACINSLAPSGPNAEQLQRKVVNNVPRSAAMTQWTQSTGALPSATPSPCH